MNHDILKKIPPVNNILELEKIKDVIDEYSHELVVNAIRKILDEKREEILSHIKNCTPTKNIDEIDFPTQTITDLVIQYVERSIPKTFERAINATGIILHTCLGRSPLPNEAITHIAETSKGYSTLEIDKDTGKRSSRYKHIKSTICSITGATDALLVNNNAAAVLLVLDTLTKGKEVIVSRSELVEIGGSFRMPDIMEKSGANLIEVGTTNRTYLSDYKKAISESTGLILIVHPSNFHIHGFTTSPDIKEIATLGKNYKIPTLYDLGSGAMIDFKSYGSTSNVLRNLPYEPIVKKSVEAGIDIITFSTDKLLGGPQGGLIIGKKKFIDLCKKNSLLRALRVDKMTISALDATLRFYLNESNAVKKIPILRMIFEPVDKIVKRINDLTTQINKATNNVFDFSICDGTSEVGGGSFASLQIPTKLISISSKYINSSDFSRSLRLSTPPIFARIEHDMVLLDLRTVIDINEEKEILKALKAIADKIDRNI